MSNASSQVSTQVSTSLQAMTLAMTNAQIKELQTPEAIRAGAKRVFELTSAGQGFFQLNADKFAPTVRYVIEVINRKYPKGDIPFHSRWGHFRAGGVDRGLELKRKTEGLDPIERARIELDLVITSVLLDAGAGAKWNYFERGQSYSRSEGLGVASFHMFLSGAMSSDRKSMRADATGLERVSVSDLKEHFQVSESNPLVGAAGRVSLLNGLSKAVRNRAIFKDERPGNIIDYLIAQNGKVIPARAILQAVIDGFGAIWPGRLQAVSSEGADTKLATNLGDVWKHSTLGLIPFHKLSQWMTYSLIEPLLDAGLTVTGVEGLTGLAEYRNGGLIIDSGLLQLRDPENGKKSWSPDSDLVIEWRALTVFLLDQIGAEVQKALGKSAAEFPLAKVLEGGTWWAGRYLAQEKRASGEPPLQIVSDGTVF